MHGVWGLGLPPESGTMYGTPLNTPPNIPLNIPLNLEPYPPSPEGACDWGECLGPLVPRAAGGVSRAPASVEVLKLGELLELNGARISLPSSCMEGLVSVQCANPFCEATFLRSPGCSRKRFCSERCRKRAENWRAYARKKAPAPAPTPRPSPLSSRVRGHTSEELLAALVEELEPLCQKVSFGDVECWRLTTSSPGTRRREGLWRFSLKSSQGEVQVNLAGGAKGGRRKKVALGRALLALWGFIPLEYLEGGVELGRCKVQYSHLCHHPWCCNPNHGVGESEEHNKARYGCHSGVITSCPHSPKCLLMGRKSQDEEDFQKGRTPFQVISQELE